MDEKPRKSLQPIVLLLVTFIAALPLLYVLSFGPALALLQLGLVSPETLSPIYSPLGLLAEHSSMFERFMRWYGSLWIWRDDLS